MHVEDIKLQKVNKLLEDYKADKETMKEKFDYPPFAADSYIRKAEELSKRDFKREELADILLTMNKKWTAPSAVLENINRLRNKESMVVIGGQQAGLLTGPVYTINKIISLIQVARQQEKKLKKPVIPVFWIAGEDHDFDEINHIFLAGKDRMKKHTINQYQYKKKSVSSIELDKQAAGIWLENAFKELEETNYTKDLFYHIKQLLNHSKTYVDFFAELISEWFGETGLILVDSGNPALRKLESDFFAEMVDKQSEISRGVYASIQTNRQQGYPAILDIEENDAHLFYHLNEERVLLTKKDHDTWSGKQGEVQFSTTELLEVAKNHPELLSNNVVTRPLMQDLLFPSLAFVGGPGEVAYWSVLKPAFAALDCKMPIVLPRMSISFIDRKSAKQLESLMLKPADAVNYGVAREKGNWLNSQQNPPFEVLAEEVKKAIERAHSPLKDAAKSLGNDLEDLAEKNLEYLYQDVDFLRDRLVGVLKKKYSSKLAVFDQLELLLHPNSGLQERMWNILPWLNQYGTAFLIELTKAEFNLEADHNIVYC